MFFACYLAAPWFTQEQMTMIQKIEYILMGKHNLSVYSPRKVLNLIDDSDAELRHLVFNTNLMAISASEFVFAITNGKDMGTIWECGYAYAIGKPIVYYAEGLEGGFNVMLAESGLKVLTSVDELLACDLEMPEVYKGTVE